MNDDSDDLYAVGRFDARYLAFLETIATLRPSLHRYCARMTGSVSEGEDVVQESLFHAYRRLDTYDDQRPLKAWLFRIAHNRCIDALRRRGVREESEAEAVSDEAVIVEPVDPVGSALDRAVEHLVLALPPKERACVLLKDVLDYSLEEIAELVDSTVGGVKAALNRGRAKLASLPKTPPASRAAARPASEEVSRLLHLYVERFNSRDWTGLRDLIAADARICVADRFAGQISDSPYFANYERMQESRRATIAEIDGQLGVIVLHRVADSWLPQAVIQLEVVGDRVVRVADYGHCPWIIPAIGSLALAQSSHNLTEDSVV